MKTKLFLLLILTHNFLSLAVESSKEDENNISIEEFTIEEDSSNDKKNATIQILNKITAKTKYLTLPVGSKLTYGPLKIEIKSCWKSSPYDSEENKILLKIEEKRVDQSEYKTIFNGWMFSSSPGISSMEHAEYDIVAVNCSD